MTLHDWKSLSIDTVAVHAGGAIDPATGALAPPIHLSTTFEHGPGGEHLHRSIYVRTGNPTQDRLEEALTAIEGGEATVVFASGVAAGTALLHCLEPGAHLILADDTYYQFRKLAERFSAAWQFSWSVVDLTDLDALRAAIRPETRLVWAESPSNPLLKVLDLAAVAEIAHDAGAMLMVDATFATPILQRTLDLGADVVLHATTKYLGGHSDVQGGALILRQAEPIFARLLEVRDLTGAVASPFNSWLVLRGLRTLPVRVERQSANALAVARAMAANPAIESVLYPGLESHPQHALATRQMSMYGAMLSLLVRGGRAAAERVASRVELFTNATSLGGTESLIELRAAMEGPGSTTPPNLLRLSIGLENPRDLIADLEGALR